jgi:hypothetical protein
MVRRFIQRTACPVNLTTIPIHPAADGVAVASERGPLSRVVPAPSRERVPRSRGAPPPGLAMFVRALNVVLPRE